MLFRSKERTCKKLNENAPIILDYLCEECKAHFENVKIGLEMLDINYEVDSGIVRGLDYYTKTVFEFVQEAEGQQWGNLGSNFVYAYADFSDRSCTVTAGFLRCGRYLVRHHHRGNMCVHTFRRLPHC